MSLKFGDVSDAVKRMRAALAYKNKKLDRPMTDKGGEILDPTVVAPPVGFVPRESIFDRVREAVRHEQMLLAAERDGKESYFEANDFGPDEDDDEIFPSSRFERLAFDAKSFGRDMTRSKEERERLEAAENRLAKKIANAVAGDGPEEPVERRPPRRKSVSEPRRGSSDDEAPGPGED